MCGAEFSVHQTTSRQLRSVIGKWITVHVSWWYVLCFQKLLTEKEQTRNCRNKISFSAIENLPIVVWSFGITPIQWNIRKTPFKMQTTLNDFPPEKMLILFINLYSQCNKLNWRNFLFISLGNRRNEEKRCAVFILTLFIPAKQSTQANEKQCSFSNNIHLATILYKLFR